ncbi:MAG: chemotaxis response regulator protein-glutamate methylesterase [Clostridiaceae bacterium]|nr:chemotaxis response regulator protein-glutamate methylesterase [Clostridiaceae bacterium]
MALFKKKIKVIVVDDSPFMRKIIGDILNTHEEIEVIGTAKNGKEAIETIKELKPDVVTMDIEMPVMNGLKALSCIMEEEPVPIIMLSSLTSQGADATLTALELGAVDFIQKPSSLFMINAEDLKQEIVSKVKAANGARIHGRNNLTTQNNPSVCKEWKKTKDNNTSSKVRNIIAIGTSTGGPRALQHIIPLIPKDCPASFLIVQHMPAGFTKSLADRLNSMAKVVVKEACQHEALQPGHVYIAPGNFHLELVSNKSNSFSIQLSQGKPISGHRPSVDVLFHSLSELEERDINMVGVIMTGMGSDGTKGLKALKDKKGSYILAQNQESCVVYGMPKSAINAGVVDEVVSLNRVMDAILNRVEVF